MLDNKKEIGDLDLRIIIVGDENVGKKTLTKRIHMLNCSETKEISLNFNLYNEEKEKERKKRIKKLIYRNSISDEIEQNENFEYRDQETILYTENEIKKEEKRKKLMSVQKLYKFCNFNTIKISVFPCVELQPVIYNNYDMDEKKNDHADVFEKKYDKSIKGLINDIIKIISIPMDNTNDKLEVLFLFCFDLSNFKTFKSIKLYFEGLNNKFNIIKNYNMALIGNKNDKKKVLKEKQQKNLQNFINTINIKYYEISSFLYFNFENFFEQLIFNTFENKTKYNYNTKEFNEKFHIIISERSNFSKSQRTLDPKDIFPSPNKYNNNIYQYPLSKKKLVNIFKSKNKYNKKIFINKKGPLYPIFFKEKEEDKENEIKELNYKNLIQTSREEKTKKYYIDMELNKKMNEYLEPYFHKPGYSIGGFHSDHSLSLRQNRRKINFQKTKEIKEAYDDGIYMKLNKRKNKKVKSLNKRNIMLLKEELKKNKLENDKILEERHYNVKLKNQSLENEKINKILEKEKKYEKKYIQRKKKLYRSKLNYLKKAFKTTLSLKPKKMSCEPKAKFYDTVSSISLKKGFTFGSRPEKKRINEISPELPYFLDDFEKIAKKYKNKREIKSYSERFPKYSTDEVGDSREQMEKRQKTFELKRKELKNNAFSDFFDNMKKHRNDFILRKQKIKKTEDEKYKNLMNNKYFLTEIDYNQVETSYPKYSMAGKYKQKNDKVNDWNKHYELLDDEEDLETKLNYLKNIINEEEIPNIGKVRPSFPKYSFGKEKRFAKTLSDIDKNRTKNKKLDFKNDDNINNWLFKNGVFGYNDKQSYLKTQTFMGLGKRFNNFQDKGNGVPGPGKYTIKGFADLISFRNNKKNKISKTERNNSEN